MAVVLKKLVLKALIDALAYDLITVIQLHQLCHLQFHLYENKSHLMQKNMMLKGQPNEQQQTHGKQFDFKIHVLALDCCAIFAKWVARNGEQVAKESATGRLIAHETNAIEQLDHLLSHCKSVRR